ncbi:hypothetical protein [Mucilaginibacter celer]|uniref:Uncharacterized protein n=1 Tax=Mucilaginibacter celer TaxID=2305508 RepID=A0A494VKT5_9SPHI|nr:hypothetical protein [Mucilaginibacter celer]AYL95787.1 hypothetical protein HYN43_011025 [Mucilaginibacter celer]
MNDRKFKLLLKVINFLSVVSFEKYWKNGVKIVFRKKKRNDSHQPSSETGHESLPKVNSTPQNVTYKAQAK